MAKCFIIFGKINKKLILLIVAGLIQIINSVINLYDKRKRQYKFNNTFLSCLVTSISQILVKLYPLILKISNEQKSNIKLTKKKQFLHYFVLCLIFIAINALAFFTLEKINDNNSQISQLFPNNNPISFFFEMIFLISISAFLLKYKYFKHHIISLIVLIIVGLIPIIISMNYYFSKKYFINSILRISLAALDSVYRCYQKYLMEKFYYPYWNIAFVPGIILFPIALVLSSLHLSINYSDIIHSKTHFIIFNIIWPLVFNVIMCPLTIMIVYYFYPDYILIITLIASISETIIFRIEYHAIDYISVPIYIIQIFTLPFYLEILECNFCGLNKNTRRNIHLRSEIDQSLEQRDTISEEKFIDINVNYSLELEEKIQEDIKSE